MSTVTMRQDPIAAATIHFVSRTQEINLKPAEKLSPRWLAWVVLVGATESTGGGDKCHQQHHPALGLHSIVLPDQARCA